MAAVMDIDITLSEAEDRPIKTGRLVFDCFSAVADLVQREVERFPALQELGKSPTPPSNNDTGETTRLSYRVKSSIRSLSEDAWSVFQSVTSLINDTDSSANEKDAHAYTLKCLLESLRSTLQNCPAVTSEGDQGTTHAQGLLGAHITETQDGSKVLEVKKKLCDTYKAAQELRVNSREGNCVVKGEEPIAISEDAPILKSLSKVLSELDGLMVLLETDIFSPQSLVDAAPGGKEPEDIELMRDSELEGIEGTDEPAEVTDHGLSTGTTHQFTPSRESKESETSSDMLVSEDSALSTTVSQGGEIGSKRSVCKRASKEAKKTDSGRIKTKSPGSKSEKISKVGKGSDTVVRSKASVLEATVSETWPNREKSKQSPKRSDTRAEVSSASCLQFLTSKSSATSSASLSADSMSSHTFTKKSESTKRKSSSPKRSLTSASSNAWKPSVTAEVDPKKKAPKARQYDKESNHDTLAGGKSKNDKNSKVNSPSQKRKPKENSPSEEAFPLERRSSVIDLQACQEDTVPPHLSAAQWDMIPAASTSCPIIAGASSGVRAWSSRLMSSHFQCVPHTRQIIMILLLYLSVILVTSMAVLHIGMDFLYAPITDYAGMLISDIDINVQELMKYMKYMK